MINLTTKELLDELIGMFCLLIFILAPLTILVIIMFLLSNVIDWGYPIFGAGGFISLLFLLFVGAIVSGKSEKEKDRLMWKEFDEIHDDLENLDTIEERERV